MEETVNTLRSITKRELDKKNNWGRNQLQRMLQRACTDTLIQTGAVALKPLLDYTREEFEKGLSSKTCYNSTNSRIILENSISEAVIRYLED